MDRDVQRVGLMRQLLAAQGYDAVVVRAPANVLLFSGYLPLRGDSYCFFKQSGEMTLIVPDDEQARAETGWADHIRTFSRFVDGFLQPASEGALPHLRELLGRYGRFSKLGYEHGPLPFAAYGPDLGLPDGGSGDVLKVAGHGATWYDCSDLTEAGALWKTAREMSRLRRAGEVAAAGLAAAHEIAAPGVPPGVIAGAALGAMAASAAPGEEVVPFCRVSDAPGGTMLVRIRVAVDGLWAAATRVLCSDPLSPALAAQLDLLEAARAAAVEAVHNGVLGSEVDAAARAVVDRAGSAYVAWTGHGVGFHADSPLARPTLSPGSIDALRPNMAFTIAPGLRGSLLLEDTLAFTSRGIENLTAP
jgi:Xaa-Pro aminopeptidase